MNPRDPDYDPKGYQGGKRGRGPKPKLEEMIGNAWNEPPGEMEYEFAALGLGKKADELLLFETNAALQVWVFRMHALRGSKEHFQELGDRASPKPSRLHGAQSTRTTRGKTSKASRSEQEKWFDNIEGEYDDEEDDADLM